MILLLATFLSFNIDTLSKSDTIIFSFEELSLLFRKESMVSENGKLINGTTREIEIFNSLNWKIDSLVSGKYHHYCLLKGNRNFVSEEGLWNLECFFGPYKKYHSNGKLAELGSFANPYIKSDCYKIGNWQYFNKKGKLIKEENYDENGKLLNVINY